MDNLKTSDVTCKLILSSINSLNIVIKVLKTLNLLIIMFFYSSFDLCSSFH